MSQLVSECSKWPSLKILRFGCLLRPINAFLLTQLSPLKSISNSSGLPFDIKPKSSWTGQSFKHKY